MSPILPHCYTCSANYQSNQKTFCQGCKKWDYPRNRTRHERCHDTPVTINFYPPPPEPDQTAEQTVTVETEEPGFHHVLEEQVQVSSDAMQAVDA